MDFRTEIHWFLFSFLFLPRAYHLTEGTGVLCVKGFGHAYGETSLVRVATKHAHPSDHLQREPVPPHEVEGRQ